MKKIKKIKLLNLNIIAQYSNFVQNQHATKQKKGKSSELVKLKKKAKN